jgi:anaerobic magnesium-protoporphyrin IX monomethyl ester cyclase
MDSDLKLENTKPVSAKQPSVPILNHDDTQTTPLNSSVDFSKPEQMRVCFPVLLDGDLVMSTEHLGVGYLVSILRNVGIDCLVVEIENDDEAIEEIKKYDPHMIGLSLTTITVSHATEFGSALRQALPDVNFIAGGPLATFLGGRLLDNPNWQFLDALVRGEGDVPMIRYVEAFWTGRDYSDIPSISWRDADGQIQENPIGKPLDDLDMLPQPARDQFELHNGKLAYLRIATTRGCSARCTFCNAPHAGNKLAPGKLWRARNPEKIVDEIEELYHKYSFNTFDFVDSTFEDPGGAPFAKDRIRQIAQGLIDRDLTVYYNCCMQAKNWSESDRDLLELMFKSGLEKVLIGVESGSQRGLDRWKKKSTVEDNKRAIKLLRSCGIYVSFGFIAYHPWSDFDEIRENNAFLNKFLGHNLRRYTVRLELYPGAEAVTLLRMEGKLHQDFDTSLNPLAYDFHDPRVLRLSKASALLYGEKYAADFSIDKEPAVFEFETYDIVLHTYHSRLQRFCMNNPTGLEILESAEEQYIALKRELADFNYELISNMTELAEQETLTDEYVLSQAPVVEDFFRERLNALRKVQLLHGRRLHRAGINVREIQYSKG